MHNHSSFGINLPMISFLLGGVGRADNRQCVRHICTLSSHLLEVSIRSAMLPEAQPISVGGDTLLNPHVGKVGCRDLVAKPLVAELVVQQPVVLGFSHWYKLEIIAIGIDCLMFHAEIGRLYDCNLVVWKGEFTKILFMCLCALFEHL